MDLGVRGNGYLVVGGTSGMGLATAKVLAAEGADVVVAGRNVDKGAAAEAAGAALSGSIRFRPADVASTDSVEALVGDTADELGGLRGVAIFTGIIGHDPIDISDEEWVAVFQDVYLGTVRVARAALAHLEANGGGAIVTTSAYSIRAPDLHRAPYTSMKAGIATFSKAIAKAYGSKGIRVNCICPGAIETEPMTELRHQLAEARGWPVEEAIERAMTEEWGLEVGLGRPGRPDEVGDLAAFLLSERAGYLTGALVNIDGGTDF